MSQPNAREMLRNIGVVAHVDAGKTTLSEQLLLLGGAIRAAGKVDEGLSTMDYLPEEQRRGITIRSGVASFRWRQHKINFIDTPGHVDFGLEVERALRVLDGAVVVFSGVRGVEPRSRSVWKLADRFQVRRAVWINKLDVPGADFAGTVLEIEDAFGVAVVPVNWPVVRSGILVGAVDLVRRQAWGFQDGRRVSLSIPADWAREAEPARERMLEQASLHDDDLVADLLEGRNPEPVRVVRALRRGSLAGTMVPATGGSALRGLNVEAVLDAVVDCLPAPVEPPELRGHPGCGLVFKRTCDPGLPTVALVRMMAGRFEADQEIRKGGSDETGAIGSIHAVFADRLDPRAALAAGDIGAIELTGDWAAGDTLVHPQGRDHRFEDDIGVRLVLEIALEARDQLEQARVEAGLQRLVAEDGGMSLGQEPGTGRWLVRGQGEVQLDVLVSRLREEFGCDPRVTRPVVRRRERLLGGAGPASETSEWSGVRLTLDLELAKAHAGEWVRWIGATPPEGLAAAVEAGLEELSRNGRAGAALEGACWRVDWSMDGGTMPPGFAKNLVEHLGLGLLQKAEIRAEEPGALLEIEVPTESAGAVLHDLRSRGAVIQAVDTQRNSVEIRAVCALEKVLGYATLVRSLSKGLATLSLEPGEWVDASA